MPAWNNLNQPYLENMQALGVKPGDAIHIGNQDFVLRAELVTEPDRVAGGFALGPRVMVSDAGIKRAGLVTEGSLINYAYRVAFRAANVPQQFRDADHADAENAARRLPRLTCGWKAH